jgi:DNA modification methylase
MVDVFREVRRVLADDGTLWLNLGDSYANDGKWGGSSGGKHAIALHGNSGIGRGKTSTGLKPKDLVGIPWRVAFALQSDGWWLRQDIIWAKPNPMPESVTDRCTKAHEYVFLLTKSDRYLYDAAAIAEPAIHAGQHDTVVGDTRNRRSVWNVATKPYGGAHFAVMPEALAQPCILAGSSPAGAPSCDCDEVVLTPTGSGPIVDPTPLTGRAGMNRPRRDMEGSRPITRREQRDHAQQLRESPHRSLMEAEAGPAFAHYVRTDKSGARPIPPRLLDTWRDRGWIAPTPPCDHPPRPADTVLDPFAGSGTVGVVALRHGRNFVGVELNPEYAALAEARIYDDGPLMNDVSLSA